MLVQESLRKVSLPLGNWRGGASLLTAAVSRSRRETAEHPTLSQAEAESSAGCLLRLSLAQIRLLTSCEAIKG